MFLVSLMLKRNLIFTHLDFQTFSCKLVALFRTCVLVLFFSSLSATFCAKIFKKLLFFSFQLTFIELIDKDKVPIDDE